MDVEKALQVITFMMDRSKKAQEKFVQGASQHTLQKNRIQAFCVALSLVGSDTTDHFAKEDLEKAIAPITSLMSKSEKARGKLAPGTWQHAMLSDNLEALQIALSLLTKAVSNEWQSS